MATNIKCPNCATVFDVEDVLSADVEQKLKQRYEKFRRMGRFLEGDAAGAAPPGNGKPPT